MALSNWDLLAFDTEGKPCSGTLLSCPDPQRSVEIYKNWLYVHDASMWKTGMSFSSPVIAEIENGTLHLSVFDIQAIRGPQNGIFCYVKDDADQIMAGIGCCGYMDSDKAAKLQFPNEYASIPAALWKCEWMQVSGHGPDGDSWGFAFIGLSEDQKALVLDKDSIFKNSVEFNFPGDLDIPYVGVIPETLDEFLKWLKDVDEEYVAKIDSKEALRFNQGDAYFASNLDIELPASNPQKAPDSPLLLQAIKQPKK